MMRQCFSSNIFIRIYDSVLAMGLEPIRIEQMYYYKEFAGQLLNNPDCL